ncbi:YqgE/AlgH family protein [Halopseudomonas maritima]|uniref:YqgE/AlgH family protein n=1 Tax=Halopseudomonas maritima TaxID=2918528 RepID=UPI001EEA6ED1|nr:YqgE/AlgH family protein [Halopseudomonas maritima]UJJ30081.1 YqgE/AlgH family protein [Halopseudomonas maritima]
MQTSPTYLTHHFLIAMPHMADPRFDHSLIYLCDHSAEGAMGLVINQPSDLNLDDLLLQLAPELSGRSDQPVFNGGPVEPERGFVLHDGERRWESSVDLGPLTLTTSQDVLRAMACGEGPQAALITLGYAGWGAGQLEQELADNVWLSCPAEHGILFSLPHSERLGAAARTLGIDWSLLTSQAGHA